METVRKEAKGTQYQDLRVEHHLKGINSRDETVVFRRPSVDEEKSQENPLASLGPWAWDAGKNRRMNKSRVLGR